MLLVIWLLRGGTEVKHWLEMSQEFQETYDLRYIHWRVLKNLKMLKCAQNWGPVEVAHNISKSEKVAESQF